MPITRDARTDRRRRLLRDQTEDEVQADASGRRPSRKALPTTETPEAPGVKRKAGYSQDVRRACGQRLVQLIPVRRRSFAAVCAVSLLIPGLLLMAHYFIHVTGQWPWWRHPLAVALDAGHPRSIAAWLSSQLWLLCLAATVLTFQLRRHKLDDYNGEYRLWFWLVLTCLVASVDATTNITKLFALALDRWTQTNMGWSGPAVVDSTLAVLIGLLGLRMCTELKSVPLSLVLWLVGLVSWAASAALARPELTLEMSPPIRYWLVASLWLAGLTVIWLSALTFLRSIYVEAQQRFLQRGLLASAGIPLSTRFRQSMAAMPAMPKMWRRQANTGDTGSAAETTSASQTPSKRRSRPATTVATESPAIRAPRDPSLPRDPSVLATPPQASRWGRWLRPAKDNDQAEEFRKVSASQPSPSARSTSSTESAVQQSAVNRAGESLDPSKSQEQPGNRRSWLPKLSRPKLPTAKLPKLRAPSFKIPKIGLPSFGRNKLATPENADLKTSSTQSPRTAVAKPPAEPRSTPKAKTGGRLSWLKLPSLGLSALKLQPPSETTTSENAQRSTRPAGNAIAPPTRPDKLPEIRPVQNSTSLPGTTAAAESMFEPYDEDEQDGRNLSKAERKRLRRNQQQRRSA